MVSRFVESLLRPFESEDRELVLRLRLWKMNWFPYRTAQFLGFDEDDGLKLGPWKWNRPGKFSKWPNF